MAKGHGSAGTKLELLQGTLEAWDQLAGLVARLRGTQG